MATKRSITTKSSRVTWNCKALLNHCFRKTFGNKIASETGQFCKCCKNNGRKDFEDICKGQDARWWCKLPIDILKTTVLFALKLHFSLFSLVFHAVPVAFVLAQKWDGVLWGGHFVVPEQWCTKALNWTAHISLASRRRATEFLRGQKPHRSASSTAAGSSSRQIDGENPLIITVSQRLFVMRLFTILFISRNRQAEMKALTGKNRRRTTQQRFTVTCRERWESKMAW